MSQQDAIKFFTWGFEDDTYSQLLKTLGGTSDWATMAVLAAPKGYTITADEAKATYQLANSWSFAAAPEAFQFLKLNYDTMKADIEGQVANTGQVMSFAEKSALAGSPAAAHVGNDIPGSVAQFAGLWTISLTDTGNFAFRQLPAAGAALNGAAKMLIQPDGKVWASGVAGYLEAKGPSPDNSGDDLRILYPPKVARNVYDGWIVSVTQTGNLAFKKGGQTKMYITADGAFWSAGAGGFLKKQEGPGAPVYNPSPLNMLAQGAQMVVAGGFMLAGQGFNAAVDWTKGAANEVWNWTTGAANSVADWTKNAGGAVASWVTNAATDAANWTAQAAQDAANWTKGAFETVGNALNPSNW